MIARIHGRSLTLPKAFLIAAAAIALSPQIHADVTYNYTGNLLMPGLYNSIFTSACSSPECNITGGFVVTNALDANLNMVTISPVSFSFQFGMGTPASLEFDQSNTSCFFNGIQVCTQSFEISTDAAGDISQWQIKLGDFGPQDQFLITSTGDSVSELSTELFWLNATPGTFTSTAPEPSALILVGTMCCICFLARRRSRRNAPSHTPTT